MEGHGACRWYRGARSTMPELQPSLKVHPFQSTYCCPKPQTKAYGWGHGSVVGSYLACTKPWVQSPAPEREKGTEQSSEKELINTWRTKGTHAKSSHGLWDEDDKARQQGSLLRDQTYQASSFQFATSYGLGPRMYPFQSQVSACIPTLLPGWQGPLAHDVRVLSVPPYKCSAALPLNGAPTSPSPLCAFVFTQAPLPRRFPHVGWALCSTKQHGALSFFPAPFFTEGINAHFGKFSKHRKALKR